ncbi:sensor histidine kinase [Salegentibacter sp. HM20]
MIMLKPAIPMNELQRLQSLEELNILNTPPEAEFDNITRLASFICKTPIAFVSLVGKDKQFMKSRFGSEMCESDREISFCSHAILEPNKLMEVKDARLDDRFKENPFVTAPKDSIIYYAGIPLLDPDGMALGTLCVIDHKPNELSQEQEEALGILARQVENLLDLRRKNLILEKIKKELDSHNAKLKDFAGVVSHDMKMPLANMIITADILKAKYGDKLGEEGKKYIANLKNAGLNLSHYISGILEHYESDSLATSAFEEFDLHDMLEDIIDMLSISEDCEIDFPESNHIIFSNRSALEQIFLNLLSNSLKYNDSKKIKISISFREDAGAYYFTLSDNGIGIPADKQQKIFKLFTTLAVTDRHGNRGNGIGLSTVKRLVENLGGTIQVNSEVGKGTSFLFSVKRQAIS